MRRITTILAIIICTALLFTGCGPKGNVAFGQTASGGKQQTKDNVNIKEVSLNTDGSDSIITLYFVAGSRENSDEEESKMTSVPQYTVLSYDMPYRLAVTLQNIGYSDYEKKEFKGDDLVNGVFNVPASDERPFTLFFQLNQKASAAVKEDEDKLVITIKGTGTDKDEKYYVYTNAFDQYCDSSLPRELMDVFSPTLCQGGSQISIISQGFKTADEASSLSDKAATQLAAIIPGVKLYTAKLTGGELPVYNDAGEDRARKNIELTGGGTADLPIVFPNGTYLCSTPDGKTMLFTRPAPADAGSSDATSSMVTLWTVDGSGKKAQLTDTAFSTIDTAAFSPDGTKLAFLTQEGDAEALNLYDMASGQSRNLNEEGLGTTTSAFTWDSMGKALYAMSGEGDNVQPMKYDFTAPENERISSIEEISAKADSMGYLNGDVYFNDQPENAPGIYRIKPGTAHELFAKGQSFQISADGKWMAMLDQSPARAEGEDLNTLTLKDMATGAETVIEDKTSIQDFKWAPDGSTLYYLKDVSSADSNAVMLCTFLPKSGDKKEIAKMDVYNVFPQKAPGHVLLVGGYNGESGFVYATYSFDANK